MPLERDEGEYAYAGQLMLGGTPPYRLAYNMKFPGIYAAYALIMWVLGQNTVAIHLGLLLVNLVTVALIFLLTRRLLDSTPGAVAAALGYAILSLSSSVLGLAAHAEHFVMLPVLAGALVLLRLKLTGRWLFVSGALFGVGLLMKQPAVFFIAFGVVYLEFLNWRGKLTLTARILRTALFVSVSALPLIIACGWLYSAGVFGKFWHWTIVYASKYATLPPVSATIRTLLGSLIPILEVGWPMWALAGLGLITIAWSKIPPGSKFFILAFFLFSAASLCSGFYFRQHYFVFVLPAVCLLIGSCVAHFSTLNLRIAHRALVFLPLVVVGASAGFALHCEKPIFSSRNGADAARTIYGFNPFPEAVRVAEYLQEHTNPLDTIAILGSEPEIYFYAHRHSATGYIYTYELMEPQRFALEMQNEMIREVEAAQPKYLVFVGIPLSWREWDAGPKNEIIFDWIAKYTAAHFNVAGMINLVSPTRTEYHLQAPAEFASLQLSQHYILVYERRP